MVRYFSMHPPIGSSEQIGALKFRIGDLIISYRCNGSSLCPKNLITIQDANDHHVTKDMPKSLLEIRRKSTILYGCINSRIRCADCNERIQTKDLIYPGVCEECSDKRSERFIPPRTRGNRERKDGCDMHYP